MDELVATITILERGRIENSTSLPGMYRSVASAGSAESRRGPAAVGMSPAVQMLDLLNTLYMPLVIYLGLVGNILSLIAFLFTHLKSRTSSLYMGSLAISDSGFLFVLSFAWLNERGVHVSEKGFFSVWPPMPRCTGQTGKKRSSRQLSPKDFFAVLERLLLVLGTFKPSLTKTTLRNGLDLATSKNPSQGSVYTKHTTSLDVACGFLLNVQTYLMAPLRQYSFLISCYSNNALNFNLG